MDINNNILPFGKYFSLTLKTGGKKFLPLFATLLICILVIIIFSIICIIPMVIAVANYVPSDILQDSYAIQYYIYSGEFVYDIIPALPAIAISFGFLMLLCMLAGCIQIAMVYLITDSSLSDEKRSFGKMLTFAIKRAFPTLGTTVVLSLIYLLIFAIFSVAAVAVAMAMGIDIYSIIYYEDISQMQLGIYFIILIVFYLIMLFFVLLISVIYSMSTFARVKYKFSGIASLRYSRQLTKGKRGKIFGNILLIGLIYGVIAVLLSYASTTAVDYGIPFLPFIINLVVSLIGMLISVFWAVMFINFDNVKGKDIISSRFAKARVIKDEYFQSKVAAENYANNQNRELQESAPIQNNQTDEQTINTEADDTSANSSSEIQQTQEQQAEPDDNIKTE